MKVNLVLKTAGFVAALSLASVAFAMPLSASECGPSTPTSSEGKLSLKACNLLNRLHENAYRVRDEADQLEAYNREPSLISWHIEADTLMRMRDRINHMDQILHQLRSMEGMLPQIQQAEINKAAPAMVELTDTTQTAIKFLNKNEDGLWVPQYATYAKEMYTEAGRVERSAV
ncbi:MAG TPA: hypothetical protein VEO19_04265 [Terriglobia bacterium]|jgi:hypothetical protein|nr:hypothetical protein [Terriglobia bacterium]